MESICNQIQTALKPRGYQVKTVSIRHLPEVQEAVGRLVRQGLIAKQLSEKWHFYLETNKNLPEAATIIIIAMPQPVTRLSFSWQGHAYLAEVAPNYFCVANETWAEETLRHLFQANGYKISRARLALKTLAARSGLASYGKNNIGYIPGMGSFYRLIAFYTDCPWEEDSWQEPTAMKACENCSLCRESCPTGSITADRFLIHAENCLGFLNEQNPDIPYWVQRQPESQNAFIGCMRCQTVCPVNIPYLTNIVNGASFSEAETASILNKTPWERLSSETCQKLEDTRGVYPMMGRNLGALIEKQKKAPKV